MKLVSRDTCRATTSRDQDGDDELPAELAERERDLRFLEDTRSGRRPRCDWRTKQHYRDGKISIG